jgi:NADH:ubiquinone oxidoreductase subunit 5 (subunit L)/multisubunit Na+/H+ antiporter MnhA subunit
MARPVGNLWRNKSYIGELYRALIVLPLRAVGYVCYLIVDKLILDRLFYDGLVQYAPRAAAEVQAATTRGRLQGYATCMAAGLLLVVAIVLWVWVLGG